MLLTVSTKSGADFNYFSASSGGHIFRGACARRDVRWKGDIPQQLLHDFAGIVMDTRAASVLPTASVTVLSHNNVENPSTFTAAFSEAWMDPPVVPDCSFPFNYGDTCAPMFVHAVFRTVVELRKCIGHAWRQKINTSLRILQTGTVLRTQESE